MAFQGTNREKMPFLFSTKLFQFLIWSIESEYISWQTHKTCNLLAEYYLFQLNYKHKDISLYGCYRGDILSSCNDDCNKQLQVKVSLFQIREFSICNVQHWETTHNSELWVFCLQFPTVPITITTVVLSMDYFWAVLEPAFGKFMPNLKIATATILHLIIIITHNN